MKCLKKSISFDETHFIFPSISSISTFFLECPKWLLFNGVFFLSLQTKADSFYNKESFLQEIFQNVLRTGSNLMANQTLPAWRDLSRSRRIKVASNLIQTLDEHAFLLLSVLDQPEVIQESTNEIGNDLIRFKVY